MSDEGWMDFGDTVESGEDTLGMESNWEKSTEQGKSLHNLIKRWAVGK
jgi:hypothetical protein